MHSSIDLNLYQVLFTIYNEGSITAAADKLFLTQPAVSHALAKLRDKFADPLFVRQGRRMVPTEHCQTIMPSVREGLRCFEQTLQKDIKFDIRSQERSLYLGVREILEALFFPALMQRIGGECIPLSLHSALSLSQSASRDLRSGKFDLVMDTLYPVDKDIETQLLGVDQFVLVCHQHHQIAGNLTLESYLQHQHVVASLRDTDINIVDRTLTQIQHIRDIALRCENFFAAIKVLCRTDLIMTMPSAAARQFAKFMPVQILDLPFEVPGVPVHMYWHSSRSQDPVLVWLREALVQQARDLLPSG